MFYSMYTVSRMVRMLLLSTLFTSLAYSITAQIRAREDINCSVLRLYLTDQGNIDPTCSHLWQVKNSAGTVALTSNAPEPIFALLNLNTYDYNGLIIRHEVSCPSQTPTISEVNYVIQSQGIFVGAENNPNQLVSYLQATSILNHQQPVLGNQLTHSNRNLYVSSVLNIDVPITSEVFFNTINGFMGPDAGINVNGRLRVNANSSFVNHCNTAWRGFEASGFLQFNDSRIEGAVYGVRPRTASVVNVVRSTLRNNYIGVMANENYAEVISDCDFIGGPLPPKGTTSIAEVSNFSGVLFTQSWSGVFMSGQSFFNNGDGSLGNRFQNLVNGYFINNSNASISGASFTNMLPPPPGPANQFGGHGVYFRHTDNTETFRNFKAFNNQFTSCWYGIRALSQNQSTTKRTVVDIFNNTLDRVTIGISLEQIGNGRFEYSNVSGNTITQVNATGIRFQTGAALLYGETVIQNNSISFVTNLAEVSGINGILLSGQTDMHNKLMVLNNQIDGGVLTGVGNSRGIVAQSLIKRSIISGNTVQNTSIAILLDNAPETTVSANLCTAATMPVSLTASTGLRVISSLGCLINDNTFENQSVGMLFSFNCESANNIRCNTMRQTKIGLWLNQLAIVGLQYETGNRWDDPGFANGSLLGARNDGADPISSLFRTAQGAGNVEYPQSIQGPMGWFVPGNASDCRGGNGDFNGGAEDRQSGETSSFALFPNPTSGHFTLQLETAVEASSSVRLAVFNQLGATVYASPIQEGSQQVSLDLGFLASGIYRVAVFDNGRLLHTAPLSIQR